MHRRPRHATMRRMHEPISLCRLTRADFPLLRGWLAQPHVARWWNHETSAQAVEADFGPTVDGLDPADIFIATTAGRAFGLIQRYRFDDNPQYLDELAPLVAVPGPALSIDYLVGPPADLGRGLGTAMIRTALASTWRDYADAPCVVVPVCVANIASWKALERAGFRRVAEGLLAPDNPIDAWDHYVYRIDRA